MKQKRGCLHKFILQRRERLSIAERKALAWELAIEIILEFDVILLKCDYHMGDMLREKFKYKNEAGVIKTHLVSSFGLNG